MAQLFSKNCPTGFHHITKKKKPVQVMPFQTHQTNIACPPTPLSLQQSVVHSQFGKEKILCSLLAPAGPSFLEPQSNQQQQESVMTRLGESVTLAVHQADCSINLGAIPQHQGTSGISRISLPNKSQGTWPCMPISTSSQSRARCLSNPTLIVAHTIE